MNTTYTVKGQSADYKVNINLRSDNKGYNVFVEKHSHLTGYIGENMLRSGISDVSTCENLSLEDVKGLRFE